MTDVVLAFEVHQPFRVRKDYFWDRKRFQRLKKEELFNSYFDTILDQKIFERTSRKCYFPTNQILLKIIDLHKHEKKKVKVSFSLSGLFLDQCEKFNKDVLESFRQLAETGCVEFLEQTYYHSLASLYPNEEEFEYQIRLHKQAVCDLIGFEPKVFENTEFLYNNSIAKRIEKLGYKGIYTEGVKKIIQNEYESVNYVHSAKGCRNLRVLLRNYKLTDDIAFRFSAKGWSEFPLTAEKYASWLAKSSGQVINIFPDYETFGEHQWSETGIHDFLENLFLEINDYENLNLATPSDVISIHEPKGLIDIPEFSTISWADVRRDTSGWIGNTMQWAYYTAVRDLQPLVQESRDPDFIKIWRCFQTSDHLYYMFNFGGASGEVHKYFSPYETSTDAFVICLSALLDFELRLRLITVAANEPFIFQNIYSENGKTSKTVWSLKGFQDSLSIIDRKSLEYHNSRGDFSKWARSSLKDESLAVELQKLEDSDVRGSTLRDNLFRIVERKLDRNFEKLRSLRYY